MNPTTRLRLLVVGAVLPAAVALYGQEVRINIDTTARRQPISPYLYGKNNCISDDPGRPLTAAEWQFLRDAGVRLVREHGGNNGTKYNWQKKLTSHPDWYNNVYAHDWDYAQSSVQQNLPGVQVLWAFQLIGRVADNAQHNFNDWGYNQSQWWSGVAQNLAGGGSVNASGGSKAAVEGNPGLYLANTNADTSTAILDHWIKPSGLGLDRAQFRYWNMDNEPEIWSGTHDDVMPTQIPAEEFMQRYFAYAKAARARFPEIKLVGPVAANEWQWYNYGATPIVADGRQYPWLEYFIKRIGEEQDRSGVRLLDVLDLHYYPGITDPAQLLQVHRVFFDPTYVYPEANGVKTVNGGWDNAINQEYIFVRCRQWLDQYLGANHGVTFGVTEAGFQTGDASVAAVLYASILGEFSRNGVEVFAPWHWQPGMWEVLHLFSRYSYSTNVSATSDDETTVSAYVSEDERTGNLAVMLVNRSLTQPKTTGVTVAGAALPAGSYQTLRLSGLPATETFVSHLTNALQPGTVAVAANHFSTTLPPLSITAVLLRRQPDPVDAEPAGSTRLANVSVRANSSAGADALILGFALQGAGEKQLLVRGAGPALKSFGLANALHDPVLTLYAAQNVSLAANDDWSEGDPVIDSLTNAAGAFGFPPGSDDAALAPVLGAGTYTVHLPDKGGVRGVALGEVYDPDLTGSSRLVNLSARTWVGTSADTLIAGFVIGGRGEKTVLVRAVGPGLSAYGVSSVLADPILRVYRQGSTAPLYTNDNWTTVAYAEEVATLASRAQAFPLAANSKDAALLLTLPPGSYTAVVSGAGSSTGIGLVEVYEIQ